MEFSEINYRVEDCVATVELNRPERMNTISRVMEAEIHQALNQANVDPEVRCIVLAGAGKNFCAGYDMNVSDASRPERTGTMDPAGVQVEDYLAYWYRLDHGQIDRLMSLWRLDKPVIAAVQGYVMGGGFWYQLACDVTIAADTAVFGQPEVRHTSNTTYLFAALVGWKNANRYALTGDHFDAVEALRMGLVNEVGTADELMERTYKLARRMAQIPLASLKLNKAITMAGLQAAGINSAMLLNGTLSAMSHASHGPERQEMLDARKTGGIRAFLKARDEKFLPEPFGPKSKSRS